MNLSFKPQHLARYRDIARLLLAHGRSGALRDLDPDAGDGSDADDARALAADLEAMGPTFIKLGQLLSTRSDILPPTYLDALARLQDDVEPISFDVVEEVVTTEIGARLSKAFLSFDETPLASASLGQVHRAALRDGRPVAVKVQRPGIRARIVQDMEVIEELASFVDEHTEVGRSFGFCDMVEEFRRSILSELDYRKEATNLRLLGSYLASYDRIEVPQPVDDYSTALVLTMDLVDGRNVGSLGPLAQQEIDGRALASDLFDAYLDQILVHGFFHADPHPGNVLLTSSGGLGLIDLGMVGRIGPDLQDDLVRLLLAMSEGQGAEVAKVMAGLGTKRDSWDPDRFDRDITSLMLEQQTLTLDQMQAGRLVGDVARIAGASGLRPPPELTMLGKTLLNLDQVAQRLDPEFDPNAAIQRHVGEIMRRRMLQSASPANLLAAAMDAKEFAEKLPSRVNKVMDALAEGEMTLNVQGIDEKELMRGIQKLANRVTSGLVIAALIIGASMLMRVETSSKLLGYPTLAIICFLVAAVAGLWLVVSTFLHDLPQRRPRRH